MSTLAIPFAAQVVLAIAAAVFGRHAGTQPKAQAQRIACLALVAMLLFPLARVFPVEVMRLLGAPAASCIELTALVIPATLFFSLAAMLVPKPSDRRALMLLNVVAAIYFVKAGWWMISPGLSALGPTRIDEQGICRQSTGYTCVAASMVTMLRARGIPAEEGELASLCRTQPGGGATDSRAVWALQTKLAGLPLVPRYAKLDLTSLVACPKPCMVQLDWGFFVSHMVPVMSATPDRVVLGDPLSGRREMAMAEFLNDWKGLAITLEEKPK